MMPDQVDKEFATFVIECWEEARRIHNDRHGKNHRNHIDRKLQDTISAEQLMQEALNALSRFVSHRNRLAGKVLWVFHQLERHSRAIDVLIQLQPSVAPAVWGPMRVILQVVNDKEKASHIAIEGIHHLAWHLQQWEALASIFSKEQSVRQALVQLYEPTLDFLISAKNHLTAKTLRRLWLSILAPQKDRLEDKLDRLEAAAKSLNLVVQTIEIRDQSLHRTAVERQLATIIANQDLLRDVTIGRLDSLATEQLDAQGHIMVQREDSSTTSPSLHNLQMVIAQCFKRSQQEVLQFEATLDWLAKGREALSGDDVFVPIVGTGQWLFSRPEWAYWLAHGNEGILWLHGKPGSGKSHLSVVMSDHLRSDQQQSVIFCSFHSSLSGPRESSPSLFAASILYHILKGDGSECLASLLSDLSELRRTYPAGPGNCPWNVLWGLCRRATSFKHRTRYFLVLDALDECRFKDHRSESQGSDYLRPKAFLRDLVELSHRQSFHVAVLSRPCPEYSEFIKPNLLIHVDQGSNTDDVQRFVLNKFSDYDIPPIYKKTILEQTREKAEGMFLWVKKYLEYLEDLPCGDDDFVERLESFPSGLDPVYDRMTRSAAARLNDHLRSLRRDLFLLVYEAQEPLSLTDISNLLLKRSEWRTSDVVLRIGKPLIEVRHDKVTFIHASVKDWLSDESRHPIEDPNQTVFIWPTESHSRLAKECLRCLLDPQYASEARIGQLLHNNYRTSSMQGFNDKLEPSTLTISFNYAQEYWDFHLTAISDPEKEVLDLAQRFLHQPNFAYWSEYALYRHNRDLSQIRLACIHLQRWYSRLSEEKKHLIKVEDYFSSPYTQLRVTYRQTRSDDQILQWLTLLRLGRFFWDIGKGKNAIPVLKEAVDGLGDLLGSRAPLTLFARREKAGLYLEQGRPHEANSEFVEIFTIQKELQGPDKGELYYTLFCRGVTELLLNRYGECLATQEEAGWGFLEISDTNDGRYLSTRVWESLAYIELGNLSQALGTLSNVLKSRRDRYGKDDLFAAAVQYSIGDIQRKQGNEHESLANLKEAFDVKSYISSLSDIWALDIAISRLIAFRDFARIPEARSILDEIDEKADVARLFDRYCQTNHLRALLFSDQDRIDDAITLLQEILIKTDREKYNRALMWIILDLANMLRARGGDGDEKQAESNFNNILVDLTQEQLGDPEPDPPRLLKLAEICLNLVRNRKFEEVSKLFREEQVNWYRPADLWVSFGGPAADTAWMRGPDVKTPRK